LNTPSVSETWLSKLSSSVAETRPTSPTSPTFTDLTELTRRVRAKYEPLGGSLRAEGE
jgi:hypothetical protein